MNSGNRPEGSQAELAAGSGHRAPSAASASALKHRVSPVNSPGSTFFLPWLQGAGGPPGEVAGRWTWSRVGPDNGDICVCFCHRSIVSLPREGENIWKPDWTA